MKIAATIAALGLATSVAAHGGVGKYKIGTTEWVGYSPYNGGTQTTIQRQYSSFDPILTPTGTNIRCNNAGQNTAALVAPIAAGDKITAVWTQWTHAEGPVTVYLAKCPGECNGFDGSGAVWFKIDEAGLLSGTVNKGKWGNGVILDTLQWTTTIPASLVAGNYIIRHEVLALHQANTPQFYPECAHIKVTGSGTASPSGSYLVSLPGAFSMSDPGVTIDIYSSTATTYKVPGPPVWPGNGGSTPPASSTTKAATPSSTTKAATPTSTSTAAPAVTTTPATGGTVAKYGQCGGIGYTGATGCVSGSTCTKVNDYYSQCL
ncbi:glycosyl hydrolase family 61-domain-containing protein [Peziza echinospora]|nr:glycosyl hydrolase family 61-domain-containing protein [Peziza echinospora]